MEIEGVVSPQVESSVFSDPTPQTRDISTLGGGKVRQTWGAISASLGSMRPLLSKLDKLLLDPPEGCTSKKVEDGINLLKIDVKEISSCLEKLSDLEDPPPTTKCWMNEARDLSYRMEDYIDSLIFAKPADPSVVSNDIKTTKSPRKWYNHVKAPKEQKQIVATVSEFRKCAQKAIQRRKIYALSDSKIESTLSRRAGSVSHMLPIPYEETDSIVIDGWMNELINSLVNDGDEQLRVVSVLGPAGLGKTTLARVLYARIGKQYHCRAFIRMSKKPDMKRILLDMLLQLQQQDKPEYCNELDLIDNIRKYLRNKRYLIITDDLWAASVWDIINHALPKGSHGSRIITTTQIEAIALTCCRYQSEHVFKMKPLDYHHSRKLFFNRLFGSEIDCPHELKEVSNKIVEICDGLPLATISMASLLASQPVMSVDLLMKIYKSLSSCFLANPASDRTRQALNLSFNNLPHYLKTCLMYLIMYPEGYTFLKDDLVKQWMAEGFIDTTEGQDMEKVAGSYLDQLISRRFIQPIKVTYNNEVLTCAVHDKVYDLISHKSTEEIFIVAMDYSRKNVSLSQNVRRLSLLFGDARYAKAPANITKSQIRSLRYFGLIESMPCMAEFKLLRVLSLQLCRHSGSDNDPVELSGISEMFQLRYLKIASDICIKLPNHVLQCLETLDITDARVTCVPQDMHLPNLLHLGLPVDKNLPDWLNSRSSLGQKRVCNQHSLQDLHLTRCYTLSSDHLYRIMSSILSLLGGHGNLKTIVVAPGSSAKDVHGASDVTLSWDLLAPPLLQRFEFSPHSRIIFSQLPPWIEKLGNLCILKIAVRELQFNSFDILRGLPALTALSLYVQRAPSERIVFDKAGFSVLKYFKLRFTSGITWIKFEADAMPNLLKLKLVFSATPLMDQHLSHYIQDTFKRYQHGTAVITIEHMPGLREISTKFGGAASGVEYALTNLVCNHLSNPTINLQLVDYRNGDEDKRTNQTQQPGTGNEIMEEEPDEKPANKRISTSLDPYSRLDIPAADVEHGLTLVSNHDSNPELTTNKWLDPSSYGDQSTTQKHQPANILEEEPDESTRQKERPDEIQEEVRDEYEKKQAELFSEKAPDEDDKTLDGRADKRSPKASSGLHVFTLHELVSATRGWCDLDLDRPDNRLSGIGFYRGQLLGDIPEGLAGQDVAIRCLDSSYSERLTELEYLGTVHHPHLVKLLGICYPKKYTLLVYEYVDRNLKGLLFGAKVPLPWLVRLHSAIEAAKGLAFLHEADNPIVHGNFKASNILLDSNTVKLCGFGVLRNPPQKYTMEYDVYNFGAVLLELLTGQPWFDENGRGPGKGLVRKLRLYLVLGEDKLSSLMDECLEGGYSFSAARSAAKIAFCCLESKLKERPRMRDVVDALEPLLSDGREDEPTSATGKGQSKQTELAQYSPSGSKEVGKLLEARFGSESMEEKGKNMQAAEEVGVTFTSTHEITIDDNSLEQQLSDDNWYNDQIRVTSKRQSKQTKWSQYFTSSKAKVAKRKGKNKHAHDEVEEPQTNKDAGFFSHSSTALIS